MPVMLPPGTGTTVALPQGGQGVVPAQQPTQPPARQAAPPSPFRQTHGPDLVILPHQEDKQPDQPQPAQMNRYGRPIKLGRMSPGDMEAHARAMGRDVADDAPALIFADHLSDYGDPREHIIRQQIPRGTTVLRQGGFPIKHRIPPSMGPGYFNYSEATGGEPNGGENGHMSFIPSRNRQHVLVNWYPHITASYNSGPFSAVLSPALAAEIARHVGIPTIGTYNGQDWAPRDWAPEPIDQEAADQAKNDADKAYGQEQLSRRGRLLRLARRALRLNRLPDLGEMTSHARSLTARGDQAPHYVFADYLEDRDDPRHHIVREALAATARNTTKEQPWNGQVTDSNLYSAGPAASQRDASEGYHFRGTEVRPRIAYTADGGWLRSIPNPYKPGTSYVRYLPSIKEWENHFYAPDYMVNLPTEIVDAIHEHIQPFSRPEPWVEDENRRIIGQD